MRALAKGIYGSIVFFPAAKAYTRPMPLTLRTAATLLFFAALAACDGAGDSTSDTRQGDRDLRSGAPGSEPTEADAPELRTISELLRDDPRLSTLFAAAMAADLVDALDTEGPYTLFAPSNQAFDSLPGTVSLEALTAPENRDLLRTIISYHVVPGTFDRSALDSSDGSLSTLAGSDLQVEVNGSVIAVGNAAATAVVVIPDLEVKNGVVHTIDAVLLPPSE